MIKRLIESVQPPSGGCVLKHSNPKNNAFAPHQPPSGGCVLKPDSSIAIMTAAIQPPSGGCVLKQKGCNRHRPLSFPAAFRRLCVETDRLISRNCLRLFQPPSGGCVLKRKLVERNAPEIPQPPSGGCVLKQPEYPLWQK